MVIVQVCPVVWLKQNVYKHPNVLLKDREPQKLMSLIVYPE